jgi:outer membrane receptor protein involved in Fe transport
MYSYTNPASFDSFFVSKSNSSQGGDYYNLTVNLNHKFSGEKHELTANLSYQGEKSSDTDSENEFPADASYNIIALPASQIRSEESGTEKELRFNADYTKPLFENGFLETGYQMRINDENETYLFENYDPDTDNWLNNPLYSSGNYFDHNIQAAYLTFSDDIAKINYKLGIRSEYTGRSIRREPDSDPYSLSRLDIFPSLHLTRQFKNDQQILASYSKRINRPRPWDLEPFRSYMNSFTLREGNPDLLPEFVNSFELNYQKNFGKSFFVVESYYRNTVNLITRVMYTDPELPDVIIMTSKNINRDNSLGGEIMLNLSAAKWLNINTSINLYRYWLNGTLYGEDISKNSNNWETKINSTFFLSTKSRIQTNFMYNGPSVTAQGNRKAFYFLNLAYRQDFLDRKLSATVSIQDIFGTMRHEFTSSSQDLINSVRFEREHQVVKLTLSYKLNNFKNQNRREDAGEVMMDESSAGF